MGDYGDVLEVEGSVDFIHHVEGGGLVVVKSKHLCRTGLSCYIAAYELEYHVASGHLTDQDTSVV